MFTYEEAVEEWDWLPYRMLETQFYAFRNYYLNQYDDDVEAHKQYYRLKVL